MRYFLALVICFSLVSQGFAEKVEINLSVEQKEVIEEMIGSQTIEEWVQGIAESGLVDKVEKEWNKLTPAEKKEKLK